MLLIASYVFYGWWDWRFVFLLLGSTVISFLCALRIDQERDRRLWLLVALVTNVGALAFFKYFNFFQENIIAGLAAFGFGHYDPVLNVLLPIGISFFTFHNLSYVIDIFRRSYPAERNFVVYALYLAFFPQLVAGPIARANHMLPQFGAKRHLNPQQTLDGIVLIVWGLFKKTVIADHLATFVSPVFANYGDYSGFSVTFAVLAFTFQIYCDFSAYSDIARGVAKLFGLELMLNFQLPYFARSPRDFWRRWHISLSTWIRDYLYKPLGGSRVSDGTVVRNLMLTMLLGGLWHGAAWNFVLWGGYHGALLSIQHLYERARRRAGPRPEPSQLAAAASVPLQVAGMFVLTVIGWVLFRGSGIDQMAWIFSHLGFGGIGAFSGELRELAVFVLLLAMIDGYLVRQVEVDGVERLRPALATAGISFFVLAMMVYAVRQPTEFIYFQF
jgi:D-alanyl-lipoteichoic acid acyltransferase DltB (MBOAT superfamily)